MIDAEGRNLVRVLAGRVETFRPWSYWAGSTSAMAVVVDADVAGDGVFDTATAAEQDGKSEDEHDRNRANGIRYQSVLQ